MRFVPHDYQKAAIEHELEHKACGLFMDMGLGKSVVALTGMDILQNDTFEIRRWLVIGTKKIVQSVWRQEAKKWDHLKHLTFSTVMGTERQRKEALKAKAHIYLINRENVAWLVSQAQGKWPFDGIVIDESSSFKSHDSRRFQAICKVLPATKRRIIMTGTPMPKSHLDLWSQAYILDLGERLGGSFTRFKETYFCQEPYRAYSWSLRSEEHGKQIEDKLKDICISMQAADYLKLPPQIDRIVTIPLPAETKRRYEDFEKKQVLAILQKEGKKVTAANAAALTNKLLQFCNGSVYDENKAAHWQHDEKLDWLEAINEEANGSPVLVFYSYQSDVERILKRFPDARILDTDKDVEDWNAGKIGMLIAHPLSAGHGLNLQEGGNVVCWFGLPWSLELYLQGNARIMRQGQLHPVIIHHLLCEGTIDFEVWEVLQSRMDDQNAMMAALRARIEKYSLNLQL